MCLLAIFFRAVDDAPLVVGANREERYDRSSSSPQILPGPSCSLAGIDHLGGGTWFGVNDRGIFVAVTNRHKTKLPQLPRSRGLLVRELLECTSMADAINHATQELDLHRYAGCNVICGNSGKLVVFQAGDWLRIKMLPPGLHVITNHDINDESDPRLSFSLDFLTNRPYEDSTDCLLALRELCMLKGNGHPPVCLYGKESGTVSSSLLVLKPQLIDSLYYHAAGPPDHTTYENYSPLLAQLATFEGRGG